MTIIYILILKDSFSSYKKKLIIKAHDSHSQCVVPELTSQAEEEENKDNISPGGRLLYLYNYLIFTIYNIFKLIYN